MHPADRKDFLDMSVRRVRKSRASYPKGERTCHQTPAPVGSCLRDIPYVIVGGLAVRLYMQERMTLDTDVLIRAEDEERAEQCLIQFGARKVCPPAIRGSHWMLPLGEPLDLIAGEQPWTDEALAAPRRDEQGNPVIDLPWLVLMKLASGRVQDLADMTRMLGEAGEADRRRVIEAVRYYRPNDEEDVESMIRLGEIEES